MERLTVRVPEDLLEEIEDLADQEDVSNSEAARTLLRQGVEAEDIRRENQRLQQQLGVLIEDREERTQLVRYAETEREYREAGLSTRLKWWLFGRKRE